MSEAPDKAHFRGVWEAAFLLTRRLLSRKFSVLPRLVRLFQAVLVLVPKRLVSRRLVNLFGRERETK
jgi:hypothetical protein